MSKKFSFLHFQFSLRGFTLIELLIVFAVIGVLTAVGAQSYSSFNVSQEVTLAAADVASMLHSAQSKAISQVIPSSCGTNSLSGYEVDITKSPDQYTLYVVCGAKRQVMQSDLPANITFGGAQTVFFTVGTGSVDALTTITLNGSGHTKTITVSTAGSIAVQ